MRSNFQDLRTYGLRQVVQLQNSPMSHLICHKSLPELPLLCPLYPVPQQGQPSFKCPNHYKKSGRSPTRGVDKVCARQMYYRFQWPKYSTTNIHQQRWFKYTVCKSAAQCSLISTSLRYLRTTLEDMAWLVLPSLGWCCWKSGWFAGSWNDQLDQPNNNIHHIS